MKGKMKTDKGYVMDKLFFRERVTNLKFIIYLKKTILIRPNKNSLWFLVSATFKKNYFFLLFF